MKLFAIGDIESLLLVFHRLNIREFLDNFTILDPYTIMVFMCSMQCPQLYSAVSDVNLILAFPPTGFHLPVCALDAEQCCHKHFIEDIIENVQYELSDFLRYEYNVTLLGFLATMNETFECKWLFIIERIMRVWQPLAVLMFMKFEWRYKI